MSASQKSVAAIVVALGLVTAATAVVVYGKLTTAAVGSSQPGADTEDKQRSAMGEDEVGMRSSSDVEAWVIFIWIWRGRNWLLYLTLNNQISPKTSLLLKILL